MCDQTKAYEDGAIVWVKLSNCWWPGEVYEETRLPQDLIDSLKKKPFSVVKFFQEDSYEYVKNINNIYRYQCGRKVEFIKKGLDLHRAKYKYMEKFPADVQTAERRTKGDPNIINDEALLSAKKPTPNKWAEIFSSPSEKSPARRGHRRSSIGTPSKTKVSEPVAVKPQTMRSKDHSVKILSNNSPRPVDTSAAQVYTCHLCNFSSNRLNVIVLHSKNHANEPPPVQSPSKKPKLVKASLVSSPKVKPGTRPAETSVTKKNVLSNPPKRRQPVKRQTASTVKGETNSVSDEETEEKTTEKLHLKNELLKDWSEDEDDVAKLPVEPVKIEEPIIASPVKQASPTIRCRNIPKKERRAFEEVPTIPPPLPSPPKTITPPLETVELRTEVSIVQKKKKAIEDFQKEESCRIETIQVESNNNAVLSKEVSIEKDLELSSQIDNLLNDTTELSKCLESSRNIAKSVEKQEVALPPKERGKRFFKSRHQVQDIVKDKVHSKTSEIYEMNDITERQSEITVPQTNIAQIPRKRKYDGIASTTDKPLEAVTTEENDNKKANYQNGSSEEKSEKSSISATNSNDFEDTQIADEDTSSLSTNIQSKTIHIVTEIPASGVPSPGGTLKLQSQKFNLQKVQSVNTDLKNSFVVQSLDSDSKLVCDNQISSNSLKRITLQELKTKDDLTVDVLKASETTTRKEDDTSLQDKQLLAIPGETFGGPNGSFFLCTVDEGNFIPIDNQPLYLDDSNQLVPRPQTPPDFIVIEAEDKTEDEEEQEMVQIIIGDEHVVDLSNEEQKYLLNAGNGKQILLDHQSLLAIATGSEMPRFITADGQEVIIDGSPQDILSSITLPQSELDIQDNNSIDNIGVVFANELPQIPPAAQVSETNAILMQPPIMSTLIVPSTTTAGDVLTHENGTDNLEERLESVIGVKTNKGKMSIPSSLELPITITNPVIVSKANNTMYNMTTISDSTPVVLEHSFEGSFATESCE